MSLFGIRIGYFLPRVMSAFLKRPPVRTRPSSAFTNASYSFNIRDSGWEGLFIAACSPLGWTSFCACSSSLSSAEVAFKSGSLVIIAV